MTRARRVEPGPPSARRNPEDKVAELVVRAAEPLLERRAQHDERRLGQPGRLGEGRYRRARPEVGDPPTSGAERKPERDAASPARTTDSELNIVQTAQQAGQFKTLLALATKAGLADDLATGELTVLAPTDAAFKKVPKATLRAVQRNPKLLKRVLLYHVIKGRVPSTTVVTLKSAKTLAGPAVKIRVTGNRVFVNNARVTTVDVPASNGVIHVINRVLIPPK